MTAVFRVLGRAHNEMETHQLIKTKTLSDGSEAVVVNLDVNRSQKPFDVQDKRY